MEFIAFIAARGGSKSIPGKNIRSFCGKPLIYWNLRALSGVSILKKIYVATDSRAIRSVVEGFNFEKVEVYDRDPKNATDSASTESVMLEFINAKKIREETRFLLSQATCPVTRTEDFERGIAQFLAGRKDSLLSCARMKRFIWDEKGTPVNYDYTNRPRRQDFNGVLMENGAFYINSVGNIKRYSNRLSGSIEVFEMPHYSALDLDEPEDWLFAESIMRKYVLSRESAP